MSLCIVVACKPILRLTTRNQLRSSYPPPYTHKQAASHPSSEQSRYTEVEMELKYGPQEKGKEEG